MADNTVRIICPQCNGHKTCTEQNGGYCMRGPFKVASGWIWATKWEER